jgi:hypothetical protein
MITCTATGRAIAVAVGVFAGVVGCNDEPRNGNGVNDVRAACELRTSWVRVKNQCSICESAVISPRCECSELAAFSGACSEQTDARKPVCAGSIDDCVHVCALTDCNCIEGCYANDARCKSASAARDGCITETCASYCK